jgi:nucleotide-binding universal stress UspA family protein
MLKKILVPLDGSKVAEQILPHARLLAEACKVPVELLSVDESVGAQPASSMESSKVYLRAIVAASFPGVQRVDPVVERGKPAEVIVDRAKREPGCLITMVTHGRSGIRRWLLGSVAAKIVQGAESPLMLVRARETPPVTEQAKINSVIVPLDGSELAESALPPAREIAQAVNAELVLVRAVEVPPTAYYRTEDVPPIAEPFIPSYDEVVADLEREAREYLDAKAKVLRGEGAGKVRVEILIGDAAEEIIKLARDTTGSLIAICTHGRSGVKRWVLGSVTEKVVHHGDSPILVIRAR